MQRIANLRKLSSIQQEFNPLKCSYLCRSTIFATRLFSSDNNSGGGTEKQTTIACEKISLKNDGSMLVKLFD